MGHEGFVYKVDVGHKGWLYVFVTVHEVLMHQGWVHEGNDEGGVDDRDNECDMAYCIDELFIFLACCYEGGDANIISNNVYIDHFDVSIQL